jgi:hypothetical protein
MKIFSEKNSPLISGLLFAACLAVFALTVKRETTEAKRAGEVAWAEARETAEQLKQDQIEQKKQTEASDEEVILTSGSLFLSELQTDIEFSEPTTYSFVQDQIVFEIKPKKHDMFGSSTYTFYVDAMASDSLFIIYWDDKTSASFSRDTFFALEKP